MHEEGLIDRILDVQSFDLDAAKSLKITTSTIRSAQRITRAISWIPPSISWTLLCSALEIDTDFNVNVLTGSDGVIRGAIGGHPDTAEGASLSVVVAPLTRGRIPTIVKHVNTVVTPGDAVDVVVTDQGIAVNPRRPRCEGRSLRRPDCTSLPSSSSSSAPKKIVGVPEPIR